MLAILSAVSALSSPTALRFTSRRHAAPTMRIIFDDAEKWIGDNLGAITKKKPMGGGSGWASLSRYEVAGMDADIVVKASSNKPLESMFLGEALGLKALGASKTLKIPEVYHMADGFEGGSYFVMDYLEYSGRADPTLCGRKMAEMHLAEPLAAEAKAGRFGFDVDNTCGDTPQLNSWTEGAARTRGSSSTASSASVPDPPRAQHAADEAVGAHRGDQRAGGPLRGARREAVDPARRPVERQHRRRRRRARDLRPGRVLRPPRGRVG